RRWSRGWLCHGTTSKAEEDKGFHRRACRVRREEREERTAWDITVLVASKTIATCKRALCTPPDALRAVSASSASSASSVFAAVSFLSGRHSIGHLKDRAQGGLRPGAGGVAAAHGLWIRGREINAAVCRAIGACTACAGLATKYQPYRYLCCPTEGVLS